MADSTRFAETPVQGAGTYHGVGTSRATVPTVITADEVREIEQTRVRSPLKDAIRRFMKNWAAVGSAAVVILLILAALLAPYLWAKNAITPDLGNTLGAPSGDHWFGTDAEGRDLYTRMLLGLRLPLIISFIGTGLTVIIGLALGLAAGYFGGWIDSILSRFTDLMFAFPSFLLAFILIDVYGSTFDNLYPGGVGRALILIVVFAVVSWPPLYRFVRSLALTLKEQQFIEAARTVGTSNIKMIWRHLAPNVYGLVLVQAALTVAFIIGTEAVLSILGLGVNEPTPDLGRMLYDGYGYMDAVAWGVFFPCLFLTILIVAFTFIGDGIRDAVDPRSTR